MSYDVSPVELPDQHTAVVRGRVAHDGIPGFLGGAFGAVMEALAAAGRQPSGPPFARYTETGDEGWEVEAGFPVGEPLPPSGSVTSGSLPGGRAAHVLHRGSYEGVAAAWEAALGWVAENGYQVTATPWECYLDEPDVPEPRTAVFVPYATPRR